MAEARIAALEKTIDELVLRLETGTAAGGSQQQAAAAYHQVSVPLPKPIDIHGDVKANVKYFKSIWENYELASGLHARPNNEQIAVLLSAIGEDCYKSYENFPLTEADRATKGTSGPCST